MGEREYEQLVLPKNYHSPVLNIAHAMPMSGQLGREMTMQRISKRFYCPTVFKDVRLLQSMSQMLDDWRSQGESTLNTIANNWRTI